MDIVRKWRRRFSADGIAGIADLLRSRRPPVLTPVQVAQVKAMACSPPVERDLPLVRWSPGELVAQVVAEGLVSSNS